MQKKVEVTVEICDVCERNEVNAKNKKVCNWCHRVLCDSAKCSISVPVRDEKGNIVKNDIVFACPECVESVYSDVIKIEADIKEIELKLEGLKKKSYEKMRDILQKIYFKNY